MNDTDRINWMEKSGCTLTCDHDLSMGFIWKLTNPGILGHKGTFDGESAREVIDQAIKAFTK